MSALFVLTLAHVIFSLIVVVAGMRLVQSFLTNHRSPVAQHCFFVVTALTLITSFLFPFQGVTPGIAIGILCVLVFIPTWFAAYRSRLTRPWRLVYVAGSVLLLYLNCVVLIVQSFQKIGFLHEIAPVGNESAVTASQAVLLLLAVAVGALSLRRFGRIASAAQSEHIAAFRSQDGIELSLVSPAKPLRRRDRDAAQ
jgi:hypothetical protein